MDIITGITMHLELSDIPNLYTYLEINQYTISFFFLVTNRLGRDRACRVRFQVSSVDKRQGSGIRQA
jgi:hypothetical protein